MKRRLCLFVLAVALLPVSAFAQAACAMVPLATLRMSSEKDGRVAVPVTISGQTLALRVDTGARVSVLTRSAADALGLRAQTSRLVIRMYGGQATNQFVRARNVALGEMKIDQLAFYIVPDESLSPGIDGLFDPELRNADIELDFARGILNIFPQLRCPGAEVYWTKDVAARVPFQFDKERHIRVEAELDGHRVLAMLDTGTGETVGSYEDITAAHGIDAKDPVLESIPVAGVEVTLYRYPFKTLTFEGIDVLNPRILLFPNAFSKMPAGERDLILGTDVLSRLHLYVAYGEHMVYVTTADEH